VFEVRRLAARVCGCACALSVLGSGMAAAQAATVPNGPGGHEEQVMVDPTLHRFMGTVTGVGAPDAQGRVYSFQLAPVGHSHKPPAPGEFRGWRLTMLSGKRFPETFEIGGNTALQVTVAPGKRPIDGIGVHDMFIIESIDAAGHSMFAPTGAASAAASGG
jgi:hypothetical protein